MNRIYNKSKVTKTVLDQLKQIESELVDNHDSCMSKWWVTKRSTSGLQLTRAGYNAFNTANIDYEDRILDTTNRGMVWEIERLINKALPCPHFTEHNSLALPNRHAVIRLYDARLVVWIDMCGSFENYLQKWELRKNSITQTNSSF